MSYCFCPMSYLSIFSCNILVNCLLLLNSLNLWALVGHINPITRYIYIYVCVCARACVTVLEALSMAIAWLGAYFGDFLPQLLVLDIKIFEICYQRLPSKKSRMIQWTTPQFLQMILSAQWSDTEYMALDPAFCILWFLLLNISLIIGTH